MRQRFIIALLGMLLASTAGAATRTVPSEYPTIQAAIAAAGSGDTILVGPGNYSGNIIIDRNIALLSVGGRDMTTITGNQAGGELGAIQVAPGSNGVQIGGTGQGFKINGIDGPAGLEKSAIYLQGNHTYMVIQGNEIVAQGDEGLMSEYGAVVTYVTIDGNIFSGQTFIGPNPAGYGFSEQFSLPNVPRQLVVMGGGAGGLNTQNITFTNNLITGTAGGLNNLGNQQGNELVTIDASNSTITGNTFQGTTTRFANSLRCRRPLAAISGNTFISTGLTPTCGQLFLQNNVMDAALVAANTFDKGVYVANALGGMLALNIQGAITAAPAGSTIDILAGTYVEQLLIEKNLTLRGAGPSTVVQAFASMPFTFMTSLSNAPLITVRNVDNVVIRDLKVDGAGMGNSNYRFYGIFYRNAGGLVDNVTVLDVRDTPFSGAQHGNAIYAYNDDSAVRSMVVSNCLVERFQKNGITFNASATTPFTVSFVNNNIQGYGATTVTAQNGIQVYGAMIDATVTGNTINGFGWMGALNNVATGMLLYDHNSTTATDNVLTDCQEGIVAYYGDLVAQRNLVQVDNVNTNPGVSAPDGIYILTDAAKAASQRTPSPFSEGKSDGRPAKAAITVSLLNNEFTCTSPTKTGTVGIAFDGEGDIAITAHNNYIKDFDDGIAVYDGAYSVLDLKQNGLSGNTVAVRSAVTGMVDASGSWLGASAPATVAAMIVGNVDITPWLASGTDTNGALGFQGDFSGLYVEDASPQFGVVGRIREGLDLVSGSTVNLAPGTYDEAINLNAMVNLIGAGSGIDPLTNSIITNIGHVVTISASGVSAAAPLLIKDLRIVPQAVAYAINLGDGQGFLKLDNVVAYGNLATNGLKLASTATFHDLDVVNCAFDHHSSGWYNDKLSPWTSNFTNITVANTSFSNNKLKGLYVEKLQDATFTNCTFSGNGTDPTYAFGAGVDANLKAGTYSNLNFINCTVTNNALGAKEGVGLTIKGRGTGSDSYSANPAFVDDVVIQGGTYTGNERGIRFGEPLRNNTTPTNAVVTGATIANNVKTYSGSDGSAYGGLVNQTTALNLATCNWWGVLAGPDAPGNPSSGNGVYGAVDYAPWLNGPGGTCDQNVDEIQVTAPLACLTPENTCAAFTVSYDRDPGANVRGVSVTLQLSSELTLCDMDPDPLHLANNFAILSGVGSLWGTPTNLQTQVYANGGNSYTVDMALLGSPCGPTGDGNLFTVSVAKAAGIVTDDTGTVTVTGVTVRDCDNVPLGGVPGAPATVSIDLTAPATVTSLAATQDKTDNGTDGVTAINLGWTASAALDVDHVEIYRKGFGNYPEYDDAPNAGSVPTFDNTWTRVGINLSPTVVVYIDEPTTRDFWYYAVKVVDECGNSSVVMTTTGTLNYHLGDVTGEHGPDNRVVTADVSMLGSAYGSIHGGPNYNNLVDVGPTTNYSVNGRPTTDNMIQFEDLIIFAMNFGLVSKATLPNLTPAAESAVIAKVGTVDPATNTLAVEIAMSGDGRVQGLSVPLTWNDAVVRPVGFTAGSLISDQGGLGMVLSPVAGTIDAAIFGTRDRGICGTGNLAVVTFAVLGAGDPGIGLGNVIARDPENQNIAVSGTLAEPIVVTPLRTELLANVPNPFNPATELAFALAQPGTVRLQIYSVQGRLVATLVNGVLAAGRHSVTWQGLDDSGRAVASGAYIVRLDASGDTQSRRITLMK
jgi:hypothetical protein